MSSKEINKSLQLIVSGLAGLLVLYGIFYILHKKYSESETLGIEGFQQKTIDSENANLKKKIGTNEECLNLIKAYKENIQLKTIKFLTTENGDKIDLLLNNLSNQMNSLDDLTTYINSLTSSTTTATSASTASASSSETFPSSTSMYG